MKTTQVAIIFFAGMLALAAHPVLAQDGRIVFVDGEVRIARKDSQPVLARIGDSVESGSTITTGSGRAHLKFPDQAILSLQPGTVFRVDEYNYSGRDDGSERFVASLIKGGLRAVTGVIGKRDFRRFSFDGVVATVGIRGTAFKMEFCAGECAGKADGLYVDGGEGTTVVTNGFGEQQLRRGESAYVASAQFAPQRTSTRTSVSAPLPTSPASDVNVVRAEQRFSDYAFKSVPFSAIRVMSGAGAIAVTGTGNLNSSINAGSGSSTNGSAIFLVDASNSIVGFSAAANNGDSAFALTNSVLNSGSDGVLYWGRWANGQVQAGATNRTTSKIGSLDLTGAESIHYIATNMVSAIPVTGSASYTLYASTPSTSSDGTVGQGATSGSLNVNFGSNTGSLQNFRVVHGAIYNFSSVFLSLNSGNRASFTGNGSTSGASLSLDGFFGGGNLASGAPARAGISYDISRFGNSNPIVGVAGFK